MPVHDKVLIRILHVRPENFLLWPRADREKYSEGFGQRTKVLKTNFTAHPQHGELGALQRNPAL